MKKVILTENQIKRMMDKLIVSEQETKSISTENQFYTINSRNFMTKNDGGSIKLYSLTRKRGQSQNRLFIDKELSTNPVLTLTDFHGKYDFDLSHNTRDNNYDGRYETPYDETDTGTLKTGDKLKYDKGGTPIGWETVPTDIQKILDPKTENSLETALLVDRSGRYDIIQTGMEPMQKGRIPGSLTVGIPAVILGGVNGINDVPVLGTLFIMQTDLRQLQKYEPNIQINNYEEGAQIIFNKTALKYKRNYYWIRFIGSIVGSAGVSSGGGNESTPPPKDTPPPPPPGPINLSVDFGGNFESGKYDLDTNYQKNINDKVTEIVNFIKGKKLKNFKLVITPGESRVPNQAPFKEPGSLAAKRGEILKGYLSIALKNALSIDPQIEVSQPIVGKTEWDPKLGKDNDVYKKDQFVRVSVVIAA
jgi:hypothetical protein